MYYTSFKNENPNNLVFFLQIFLYRASNQVAQWSLPLHDHLTQYVATLGRKKRNSEKNLKEKEEIGMKYMPYKKGTHLRKQI